ncbi:monofunctional biosynthetic peptidoglycan transglycosylase [Gilvibacter sp.]|uniref:monofunctional biosynthetic peptidoglycan transglycosylase n=1 Tax=Gilvibacter sp. TaxID=2729997 RepID=UPI0025BB4E10|nr:monofunctional biosynthetic peptidoglycan transglycosylase [Gilvibacter sp.]NQX76703.1 monofunctional biosynthetic peptidoglycan transglycosylase [Gilvibacter sp.]
MRKLIRFLFKSFFWFLVLSNLWVLAYRYLPVPATPLMAIRYFQQEEPAPVQHEWIALDQISPELQKAVICAEDQQFLNHNGFDVAAIKKAQASNKEGKALRGASTISQQTAKNVFLWPQRSWVRKGFEVYFTFLIETYWSKERILEVYLNSIEFGPNVYGAHAAAQHWFDKEAADLSKDQATALAAILPNPRSYRPVNPSGYIAKRKRWISKQMINFGPLEFESETTKDIGAK